MSKTIVLTGAGGVLCSRLAEALAENGHKIAVLDLRMEAADSAFNKTGVEVCGKTGTCNIGFSWYIWENGNEKWVFEIDWF